MNKHIVTKSLAAMAATAALWLPCAAAAYDFTKMAYFIPNGNVSVSGTANALTFTGNTSDMNFAVGYDATPASGH